MRTTLLQDLRGGQYFRFDGEAAIYRKVDWRTLGRDNWNGKSLVLNDAGMIEEAHPLSVVLPLAKETLE